MPVGKDLDQLYRQIGITAEDNLKLLEKARGYILVLPLRLLSQSSTNNWLFNVGEHAFVDLFDGINSLNDFFVKCNSIKDIIRYSRNDIGHLVMFSENDDFSLPFEERFKVALSETEYLIDPIKPDSYNFFIMVFGGIQQAIDIIISCVEYECIPYIRYPVSLHYISLLSESMADIEHIMKTDNEILDTVLTEKSLLCNRHKITLTCIADGRLLSFMDAVDLYTLFGSALDNAIEASLTLPESDRMIDLQVRQKAGLIIVRVTNRFAGTVEVGEDLPRSSKEDQGWHGFGLKSIRAVAEKYGGLLDLHAEDGVFTLRITIPASR